MGKVNAHCWLINLTGSKIHDLDKCIKKEPNYFFIADAAASLVWDVAVERIQAFDILFL